MINSKHGRLQIVWSIATDQLVQVVLDPRQVGERADGHQAAQSKVKQLVAEEWDEPAITVLRETGGHHQVANHFNFYMNPADF